MRNFHSILFLFFTSWVGIDTMNFYNENVRNPMNFKNLSEIFDLIYHESSRINMTKLLAQLFTQASAQETRIIANLSLGMLRPPYEGTQFNLAEKIGIRIVANVLNKSVEEVAAKTKEYGDLGLVVAEGTWSSNKKLSIMDVYTSLCEIEQISGEGSQENKINRTTELLQSMDPLSAKYVVRIILGTLRLGFSDMTIIDALSWMMVGDKSLHTTIEDAYNICADIGFIAETLKTSGIDALERMHIKIGIPIRPAAAERMPNAQAVIEKIGSCVAQPKLDGFRLQIHLDKTDPKNPRIHFFSRNLQDMSAMFPDVVAAIKELDVQQFIAEGEAIAYDPNTGTFMPFQETVKRKRKHGIEQAQEEYPLKVYIFDLLYLNGQEYLSKTHEQRRAGLLKLFKDFPKDSKIQVIEEQKIDSAKQLEDYFLQNIEAGLEGLVVKKPDCAYQPGKRNFNWIKLKRHEEGKLEDTIDTVILGYYAGSGKRAAFGIGAFLVGVYNPDKDRFETIAKIGTGLTDIGWSDLKNRCNKLKVAEQPINVTCAKELMPDVWVYPKLVCQTLADEITLSPLHTAGKTDSKQGYALRFPRFIAYRDDKTAEQATTVNEIIHMYDDQFV